MYAFNLLTRPGVHLPPRPPLLTGPTLPANCTRAANWTFGGGAATGTPVLQLERSCCVNAVDCPRRCRLNAALALPKACCMLLASAPNVMH